MKEMYLWTEGLSDRWGGGTQSSGGTSGVTEGPFLGAPERPPIPVT